MTTEPRPSRQYGEAMIETVKVWYVLSDLLLNLDRRMDSQDEVSAVDELSTSLAHHINSSRVESVLLLEMIVGDLKRVKRPQDHLLGSQTAVVFKVNSTNATVQGRQASTFVDLGNDSHIPPSYPIIVSNVRPISTASKPANVFFWTTCEFVAGRELAVGTDPNERVPTDSTPVPDRPPSTAKVTADRATGLAIRSVTIVIERIEAFIETELPHPLGENLRSLTIPELRRVLSDLESAQLTPQQASRRLRTIGIFIAGMLSMVVLVGEASDAGEEIVGDISHLANQLEVEGAPPAEALEPPGLPRLPGDEVGSDE